MAGEKQRAVELLGHSYGDGELSDGSRQALVAAGEIGAHAGRALGTPADDDGNDLLLVTILVDDSSSIRDAPYGSEAVRLGHNLCLDVLARQTSSTVLSHTRFLNAEAVAPYSVVSKAPRLTSRNYQPQVPKTPLFQQSVITLGAVVVKVREERERHRQVRAFTLLLTDGGDNASHSITSQHVRFLVTDMLGRTDNHIVAGMGIGDSGYFRRAFSDMGIPRGWILTPDATPEDIERIFAEKVVPSLLRAATGGDAGWAQLEAGPVDGG